MGGNILKVTVKAKSSEKDEWLPWAECKYLHLSVSSVRINEFLVTKQRDVAKIPDKVGCDNKNPR